MAEAPLTWEHLKVFEPEFPEDLANAMIATVWAQVRNKIAPCMTEEDALEDPDTEEAVRSIIRSVVLRWHDSGSGAVTSQTAGDYSESLSGYGGGRWRPDEINDLQQMCADHREASATTVPMYRDGPWLTEHAAWCSVNFGDPVCDCGADISANGLPLWKNRPIPETP